MTGFITDRAPRSNHHLIKRIRLIQGDITKQEDVDAIVSSVDTKLSLYGGLNQAIMAGAGEKLDEFIIENIYKPRLGDVFVVPGFDLPAKNVIFTVTRPWEDALQSEDRDLLRCYRRPLKFAVRMGWTKIAFPALGTGIKSFPVKRAARLALKGILQRMDESFEEIRIVCEQDDVLKAFKERLSFP